MKFIISDEIVQSYPALRIGCVVARNIDNTGRSDDIENLKYERALSFGKSYSLETLLEHPHIRTWRETYKSFGSNPKKYPPTIEALTRRVLKKGEFPTISKAVDLYLVAEIQCLLPVGGYDLDKIDGDIFLRKSIGDEKFIPLGADAEEFTYPGEIIYADSNKILTRRWNYKDCDFSKITESSRNIALFTEAVSKDIPGSSLQEIGFLIKDYLLKYCGGKVAVFVADVGVSNTWELASSIES